MPEHPAIVNADDSRVAHEPDGFGLELESARGIKRALLEPVDTDDLEHDLSPSACMDASEDIPHPPRPEVGVKLEWSDTSEQLDLQVHHTESNIPRPEQRGVFAIMPL